MDNHQAKSSSELEEKEAIWTTNGVVSRISGEEVSKINLEEEVKVVNNGEEEAKVVNNGVDNKTKEVNGEVSKINSEEVKVVNSGEHRVEIHKTLCLVLLSKWEAKVEVVNKDGDDVCDGMRDIEGSELILIITTMQVSQDHT